MKMKNILLGVFVLMALSLGSAVQANHNEVCVVNPYPYSHFQPHQPRIVHTPRLYYGRQNVTYIEPVYYRAPVVYYPAPAHCAPVYSAPLCQPRSGLTIKIRF
jgi:hypothetical protein